MKYLNFCFLAVCLFVSTAVAKAQTLDEVISKYVTAIGGKENMAKVTSVYTENSLSIMDQESISKSVVLNGKGAKTITDMMGQKMVQCYTDKSGWMINPMGGGSEAVDMPVSQYNSGKSGIYIMEPLAALAERGYKAELVGKEKVGANDAFKIKVTSPENVTAYYFIDQTTYYPVQMTTSVEMGDQAMNLVATFSDFRKTDAGIVMPFATKMDYNGQFNISYKTVKVEFNKAVDPAIFAKGNMSI